MCRVYQSCTVNFPLPYYRELFPLERWKSLYNRLLRAINSAG